MLNNTITLAVNEDNDGGTTPAVDNVYSRFDQYQNRTIYTSNSHSLTVPDTLTFYRTFPKTTGNYPGQAKTAAKFSKTIAVSGVNGEDVMGPLILEVSLSAPVGATTAQKLLMRQRAVALLDRDDIMNALMDNLEI